MFFLKPDQGNRRYIRVQPEEGRPIKVDINGEGFIDILEARDISVGGMGIIVPHMFEGCRIDRVVSLIVTLPDQGGRGCHFQVDGIIRHVADDTFGIQFLGLEAADKKEIKRYVASRLKDEPWHTRLKQRLGII